MQIIKYIALFIIFILSALTGTIISKSYGYRVKNLREIKNILNILKTKIKFTYEPLKDIFEEFEKGSNTNINKLFYDINSNMKTMNIEEAWTNSIENANLNLNKEDKEILKNLGKMLGKTDTEGQISEIDITSTFIDTQIQKAEEEKKKNEKLYKSLGIITGLVCVIILI